MRINRSFSLPNLRLIIIACISGIAVCFSTPDQSEPCTGFFIQQGENYISARSFDWPRGQGMVFINKRGVAKTALVAYLGQNNSVKWISNFGSVTFNQAGCDLPNFGINEAGLSVQGFIFNRAEYPKIDSRSIIAQVQWKQYLLDTCATIKNVFDACKKVRIQSPTGRFGQHYMVCDKEGNCAMMDFLNKKQIFYTGNKLPVKAYVDTSTYDECIEYLERHNGFGGNKSISRSASSLDRFVRAAAGLKRNKCTVDYAFQILEDVKIEGYTQWQIVYDSKTHKIHYRTKANNRLRNIDVSSFSYSCKQPLLFSDIEAVNQGSLSEHFIPYSSAIHEQLLENINQFYRIPVKVLKQISAYPDTFICETILSLD